MHKAFRLSVLAAASGGALLSLVVIACGGETDPGSSGCTGGKCDGVETLGAITTGPVVDCRLVRAATDDAADAIQCRVIPLPENPTIAVNDVILDSSVSTPTGTVILSALDEFDHGAYQLVAEVVADDYPITVRATIGYRHASGGFDFQGAHQEIPTRPASTAQVFSPTAPFDLWPIGIWPDDDVVDASGEHPVVIVRQVLGDTFPVASEELNVGGITASTSYTFRRDVTTRPPLTSLRGEVFYVPVAKGGGSSPTEAITLFHQNGPRVDATTTLAGPGYYLLSADGRLTLTSPDDLPGEADVPPAPDAGEDPQPDAGTEPQPDAAPVVQCPAGCNSSEVCVANACVPLSGQSQDQFCNPPTDVCDEGENGDCASGNVCAAGLCRRLTCQAQDQFCNQPTDVCDDGDNGDCASGQTCAAGLCRRLTCQAQDQFCNPPTDVCDDGDNGDCASDQTCAAGLCRRLTCQAQDQFCNPPTDVCDDGDNGDCASGQTCAAGLCRRLTCQAQDQFCNPATDVCDPGDDGDCGPANTCIDELCQRASCQ